ncbi:MAG: hypothetical protein BGO60_00740 [Thiobacillus sp. 65-1059]|nr:MAG: hypothetical protein BGO60_00740 [Thiobacillus sp. 65-1059]
MADPFREAAANHVLARLVFGKHLFDEVAQGRQRGIVPMTKDWRGFLDRPHDLLRRQYLFEHSLPALGKSMSQFPHFAAQSPCTSATIHLADLRRCRPVVVKLQ